MFRTRTLFVVGAGASAEVGLPMGANLAGIIGNKLDVRFSELDRNMKSGDSDLFAQFSRTYGDEIREYQNACWLIRDGIRLSSSIDDFLDVHSKNDRVRRVGKTAIVKSILEAERASSLFYNKSNINNKLNLEPLEDTWFIKFVRMLGRGVSLDRVEEVFDKVAFIVFNYDRCIEHFLFEAIRQLYALNVSTAASLLSKLNIIHPYGTVADLPYKNNDGIHFGGEYDRLSAPYLMLSDHISTYTEQIGDSAMLEAIREQVSAAERIVFLGFAFHDQNMRVLKPEKAVLSKQVFGTSFGMSASDVTVVGSQLLKFFSPNARQAMRDRILLANGHKCSDLFDYYAKSLPA